MIYIFIPNESIGDFFLGDNISKYNLPFRIEQKTNQWDQYDSYELSQEGISLWVEDGIIKCIRCEKECIWKNDNIIGMKYKDFITQYSVIPDTSEKIYLKSGNVGQYQMVYDFDDIGLQIWVWKGKIRTVIISNYHDLAQLSTGCENTYYPYGKIIQGLSTWSPTEMASLRHDLWYDDWGASGAGGAISPRTKDADMYLMYECKQVLKDPNSSAQERSRARRIIAVFSTINFFKPTIHIR